MQTKQRDHILLHFSVTNLKGSDLVGKSDPFLKAYLVENKNRTLLGQTETLSNNQNPKWTKPIEIDYFFERKQKLEFEIYDKDLITSDDIIAIGKCTLGQIMGDRANNFEIQLKCKNGKKDAGKLNIKQEKQTFSNSVEWDWCGVDLINVDFFTLTDPFLRFYYQNGKEKTLVHETEVIKNNLNPIFKTHSQNITKLTRGDFDKKILIECWDHERTGGHRIVGSIEKTMNELLKNEGEKFELQNEERKKKGQKNLGFLVVENIKITSPTILDYLEGGQQINVVAAIDFTASNGEFNDPTSLHSQDLQKNQYLQILKKTCNVLLNYDHNQRIRMYGFGGVPQYPNFKQYDTSHCFPLTGDKDNHEVQGLNGVIECYLNALKNVILCGPTYFGSVLQGANLVASNNIGKDIYTVLFLLTDGAIDDMDKTISLLDEAQELPLSVIIVGVGTDKFPEMRALDQLMLNLSKSKQRKHRDLVQFFAFQDFIGKEQQLSDRLLQEIPNQFLQYKLNNNKYPKPNVIQQLQFS